MRLTIPIVFPGTVGIEYSTGLAPGSWIDLGNFHFTRSSSGKMVFLYPDPIRRTRPTGFYRAFLRATP
jgi:hypothetical protein